MLSHFCTFLIMLLFTWSGWAVYVHGFCAVMHFCVHVDYVWFCCLYSFFCKVENCVICVAQDKWALGDDKEDRMISSGIVWYHNGSLNTALYFYRLCHNIVKRIFDNKKDKYFFLTGLVAGEGWGSHVSFSFLVHPFKRSTSFFFFEEQHVQFIRVTELHFSSTQQYHSPFALCLPCCVCAILPCSGLCVFRSYLPWPGYCLQANL